MRYRELYRGLAVGGMLAAGCADQAPPIPASPDATGLAGWCAQLPRPANAALEAVPGVSEWFQVYRAADGVYALIESYQFQEAISYLIVGGARALLFDTGLGLVPIRPVAERLTARPIVVFNSHTHYDHVGGNAEFDTVLALDTPYTRANMAGFPHAELAGEVAAEAFCHGPPPGVDTAAFRTPAWRATDVVRDGQVIDLGGRRLEVLHVPGHTPDAAALLDRANGLLWTGDSYYDGGLWLFVPETDLDAYQASMARMVALVPRLRQLLPAHNTARVDPGQLERMADAVARVRSGAVRALDESGSSLTFDVDGIRILTARPLLDGKKGDAARGGSGLSTWP